MRQFPSQFARMAEENQLFPLRMGWRGGGRGCIRSGGMTYIRIYDRYAIPAGAPASVQSARMGADRKRIESGLEAGWKPVENGSKTA